MKEETFRSCSAFDLRNFPKVVLFQNGGVALASDANSLFDSNIDQMLKKLIKRVIGVTAFPALAKDTNTESLTYTTMIGPRSTLDLHSIRTFINSTPRYDFPVPGGPWMNANSRVKADIKA